MTILFTVVSHELLGFLFNDSTVLGMGHFQHFVELAFRGGFAVHRHDHSLWHAFMMRPNVRMG